MSSHVPLRNETTVTHSTGHVRWFAFLTLVCALGFGAAVVLTLGLEATPYDTADRAGRPMGFNDPLNAEHFAIVIRNFRAADFFRIEHLYEWLLLAMQVIGVGLLIGSPRVSRRVLRRFFGGQVAIFPLGLLLCWFPLVFIPTLFLGPVDREFFIDGPTPFILSQSVWVLVSLFIVYRLRDKRSGGFWRQQTAKTEAAG